MKLRDRVLKFVKNYNLIKRGENVLLGVSGGPDSIFMVYVLDTLKDKIGFKMGIATFNHKIRTESESEVEFVKSIAEKLKIPFFYGECDVKTYSESKKVSLEEGAREKRLEFLLKVANENGFEKIALAHNKDDLVETVLYHLVKGAGLNGLVGIKPESFGGIIHPILCVERVEIERYLKENKIPYKTDMTNFSLAYSRNKIRHQIIPLLSAINPSFKQNVFYMSEVVSRENDFLDMLSRKDGEVITEENGFSIPLFLSLPVFEQRRIIKSLFGESASFERVERVLSFIKDADRQKENLYGNFFIVKRDNKFFIEEQKNPAFTTNSIYEVMIPGSTVIKEADCVLFARISNTFHRKDINEFKVAFDFDALKYPLFVRFRKAGDRILTEAGTKKLQDLFVDAKIPYEERARIPILTDGEDRILWVIGVRRSAVAKVSPQTKKVLYLKVRFKKN